MKITASRTSLGEIGEDVLIVPVFEGETPHDSENAPALAALDHLTRGAVTSLFDDGEMTGKLDTAGIKYELRRLPLESVRGGLWQLFFDDPHGGKVEFDFDKDEQPPKGYAAA